MVVKEQYFLNKPARASAGGLDASDGAPLAVPGLGLVPVSAYPRMTSFPEMARSVRIASAVSRTFLARGFVPGSPENVIDAVRLAPRHRFGPRVTVTPKRDARLGPALANAPHEAAQMPALQKRSRCG